MSLFGKLVICDLGLSTNNHLRQFVSVHRCAFQLGSLGFLMVTATSASVHKTKDKLAHESAKPNYWQVSN